MLRFKGQPSHAAIRTGSDHIPLRDFAAATALGASPRAFAYAALGGSHGNYSSPQAVAAICVLASTAVGGATAPVAHTSALAETGGFDGRDPSARAHRREGSSTQARIHPAGGRHRLSQAERRVGPELASVVSVFLACSVEAVEGMTIVPVVGTARRWRSSLYGCGAAMLALAAVMPGAVVVLLALSLRRAAR